MICFGNVPAGSTLPIFFDAFSGSTGASITISGLATTDIEVYKGTSMTQRASDNGYALIDTDGIDLDGVTGIHGFSIDLSDNSDASFYAAGSFYTVVVSAVTIDSQTVSFIAATFRIVGAENTAGTPVVDVGRINNVSTSSVTTINAHQGTTAANTAQTGDNYARLGAPAGASVSADIASIKTDTGTTIPGRLPAALVSGRIDASVGAMATDVLTSTALAASAVTEIQSGLSTLDAAGVRTAVGLASANLDTQLDALPTATENADALLNRDMSAVTVTNARSPINALRWLRNKWTNSGGTLTVYKEDDTTTAWTATTTTAAGDPVDSVDPA